MKKLHELYLKRPSTKPNQETDLVNFDNEGRIVSWFVYSEFLNDWLEVDVIRIKDSFPGTFSDVEEKIEFELQYQHDDIDSKIDQDRDDKLKQEGA